MADDNEMEILDISDEIESETVDTSPEAINDFIDNIAAKNFAQAKSHFDNLINNRVNDALEQEKINLSSSIFNDDDDEIELSDEEIDELLADTEENEGFESNFEEDDEEES